MSASIQSAKEGDTARAPGLLELFGFAPSENPFVNEALVQHISSLRSVMPLLLLSVLPTVALLFNPAQNGQVRAIPLAMMTLLPFIACVTSKFALMEKVRLDHRVILATVTAGAMGLATSFVAADAVKLPLASTAFLTLSGAMMILIAAFSRLPGAMLAFPVGLLILGPPLGQGWFVWVSAYALLAFMFLMSTWLAKSSHRANEERFLANHAAVRSDRLLREFEDHSPGWFWETDRQGAINYISDKVTSWFGKDVSLNGQMLTAITLQGKEGPVGERTLGFYLSSRTTFTELAVQAAIDGEERWWSISGRPVVDSYGQFRGFIGTGTDLTEKRRSEAEVEKLARFDSLTGLANRAETATLLNRALHGRPGGVRPTGLMMLDLDRFKAVNDTLGHPVGDELLKQVAARLCQVVGTIGQVGRLGGDEFKVVFPEFADRIQLTTLADAMIASVSTPYYINSNPITIGASIGIATAPENGTTSEELVRNADLALYAAKGAGRGVHRFYETTMHSVAEQKRMIENDMREALAGGQFRMVYQPVVSLEHEKIIGFEALIRWNHPTRGPISPADFIPIAEENGMIEAIGEWALRTATLEAANWAVAARVAVNVSTIQFSNPKFPELVTNALAQSGLECDRLELEITESVFVDDNAATDQQFALLKKIGIRLALDDFGTGYSSLGYLKRAPFDKIKIDQSFVRGASLGQDKNAAIIKAIVTLADTMNMETTAEGVETQDEIDFIKGLGCSHIQGFVYGRPLEAADLQNRLGTRGVDADRIGHKSAREPRMRVFRAAQLDVHGREHAVRMRNISNGGVMVEGPEWLTKGTPVSVDITDDITASGIISWIDEGRIGIKFDQRIDLSKVVAQAQAAKAG